VPPHDRNNTHMDSRSMSQRLLLPKITMRKRRHLQHPNMHTPNPKKANNGGENMNKKIEEPNPQGKTNIHMITQPQLTYNNTKITNDRVMITQPQLTYNNTKITNDRVMITQPQLTYNNTKITNDRVRLKSNCKVVHCHSLPTASTMFMSIFGP